MRSDHDDLVPEDVSNVSRRQWLQLLGVGSGVAIAGCGGGGDTTTSPRTESSGDGGDATTDGGASDTTTQDQKQVAEPIIDGFYSMRFDDMNLNDAGTTSAFPYGSFGNFLTVDVQIVTNAGDILNQLLVDYEYDTENYTETVKIRGADDTEPWLYWNGEEITSEDIYYSASLGYWDSPEQSGYDSIEMVDTYTATFHINPDRESTLAPDLRRLRVDGPRIGGRFMWKEWAEKYEDATTQEERNRITKDRDEWEVSTKEFVDNGWGTSTYKWKEYSSQEAVFEKFDDHPKAPELEIETVRWNLASGGQLDQQVVNDKLDWGPGMFEKKWEAQAPDNLQTVAKYRAPSMQKMTMNWKRNRHLARRNVRRAIFSAIDLPNLMQNAAEGRGYEISVNTGLTPPLAQQWLGDTYDDLIQYPIETDIERATDFMENPRNEDEHLPERMREQAYSKEAGKWVDQDGEEVTIELISMSGGESFALDHVVIARTISQVLKRFGMNVDFLSMEPQAFYARLFDTQEWDVAMAFHWGGGGWRHPSHMQGIMYHWGMRVLPYDAGLEKLHEDGTRISPWNGKPIIARLPGEVGSLSYDDGSYDFNLIEGWQDIQKPIPEERAEEIVRNNSWYWNFDVADIDLWQLQSGTWGDAENFTWPSEDTSMWLSSNSGQNIVKHGLAGYR